MSTPPIIKPRSPKSRTVEQPAATPLDPCLAAGRARGLAAIAHVEAATEQLEAAMRDLCSVIGAGPDFQALSGAYRSLKAARAKILYATIDTYQLDHTPTEAPAAHGCGCYAGEALTVATRRALTGASS